MDIPCPHKLILPSWRKSGQPGNNNSSALEQCLTWAVSHKNGRYSWAKKPRTFNSLNLIADQAKTYKTVHDKFDSHFVMSLNIIFERAKFNSRRQEAGDTADALITALHKLSETCEFSDFNNELIRNRIVVGIGDGKLSEKLQLDKDLTLEKAILTVSQSE